MYLTGLMIRASVIKGVPSIEKADAQVGVCCVMYLTLCFYTNTIRITDSTFDFVVLYVYNYRR